MTLGRKVCSFLVQKKIGKKSCNGLIHNQVFRSDKSDKIRQILKKKLNTLSQHPLLIRPLHDFFPIFFLHFFRTSTPSDRASYVNKFQKHYINIVTCYISFVGRNMPNYCMTVDRGIFSNDPIIVLLQIHFQFVDFQACNSRETFLGTFEAHFVIFFKYT